MTHACLGPVKMDNTYMAHACLGVFAEFGDGYQRGPGENHATNSEDSGKKTVREKISPAAHSAPVHDGDYCLGSRLCRQERIQADGWRGRK